MQYCCAAVRTPRTHRPPSRRLGRVLKLITVALVVVGLTLAWRYTPLSASLDSQVIAATFAEIADMRVVPNCRPAGVQRDARRRERLQRLDATGQRVEEGHLRGCRHCRETY